MVNSGQLGCGNYLVTARVQTAVAQVIVDGSVKEPRILEHHSHIFAQVLPGHVPDIGAVHQNSAAVRIVKSHEEVDDGGLPGSGRTDNGYGLTAFYCKV